MRHTLVAMAVGAGLVALSIRFAPIPQLEADQLAGLFAILFLALAGIVHAIRGKVAQ